MCPHELLVGYLFLLCCDAFHEDSGSCASFVKFVVDKDIVLAATHDAYCFCVVFFDSRCVYFVLDVVDKCSALISFDHHYLSTGFLGNRVDFHWGGNFD